MARYVDGFVMAIPRRKVAQYRSLARRAAKIWMGYGALEYVECMGDDVATKGRVTYARAVKLKKGEVVFFSYIVYRSRKHRDAVTRKIIKDPSIAAMVDPANNPFDMGRMLYGGFRTVVAVKGR